MKNKWFIIDKLVASLQTRLKVDGVGRRPAKPKPKTKPNPTKMKSTFRLLDSTATRKPSCWEECQTVNPAHHALDRQFIKDLMALAKELPASPFDDLSKIKFAEESEGNIPQRIIGYRMINGKKEYFYINTEGYSYARYATRITPCLTVQVW